MTFENRLTRIESAVSQPCEWCLFWQRQARLLNEGLAAQGISPRLPNPADVRVERCDDCGHPCVVDLTFAQLAAIVEGSEPGAAWLHRLRLYDAEQDGLRAHYDTEAYNAALANTDYAFVRAFMAEQAAQ